MRSKNVREKLQILKDPTSKKILGSCSSKAKSIKEISQTQNIPLAKCYRRASKLEEKGYLEVVDKIQTERKEICLYKSMLDLKFIDYGEGKKKVKIGLKDIKTEEHRPFS